MLNEHSCRYHPYSHSELSFVIFRYEIGTGTINKQTSKQFDVDPSQWKTRLIFVLFYVLTKLLTVYFSVDTVYGGYTFCIFEHEQLKNPIVEIHNFNHTHFYNKFYEITNNSSFRFKIIKIV